MLQGVAVYCSVLQCVAVCCRVLQCVAVCCSVLQRVAACCSVLQFVAMFCSALQCAAVQQGFVQTQPNNAHNVLKMCTHIDTHIDTHTEKHSHTPPIIEGVGSGFRADTDEDTVIILLRSRPETPGDII